MNWQTAAQRHGTNLAGDCPERRRRDGAHGILRRIAFRERRVVGILLLVLTANEQCAKVSGTKGYLRLADFVVPFHGPELTFEVNRAVHNVRGCDFDMEAEWRRFTVPEFSNSDPSAQETNLFRDFARQVRTGTLNESWPEMALKTQRVMEACFDSARQGSIPQP